MSGGRIINTLPEALVALDRSAKELEALKDTLGKLPAGDGKDQLIAAANLKALELTDLSAVLGMGTTHLSAKSKEEARVVGVRNRGGDPGVSPVIPDVDAPKLVADAQRTLTEAFQLQKLITTTAMQAGVSIPIAPAAAPGIATINKTDDHVGVRSAVAHRPRAGSFSARTRPAVQPGAQAGGQPAAGAQAQAGGQPAAGAQPYAGTFDDLSNVHADLDKYRQAIKLYAAHIKLAIRSAHQRASFNKKRQEIETDLNTMQTLLNFYHNHPPVQGKEDVSAEINDLTQILADLQKVKTTPQDKIMVGRGALKAEFITDTLENARTQLTTKMMTAAIVPGLSGGISREINADFTKPYASVYAINTPAGEVRTGVLQHYDATSKRLVTEYQLEKDHQTKMAQITRNSKKTGMLSSIDIPGDAILKDVYAKVALHIANPNTTQPILFNGIGLHPDEIEMHFIAFKMLNVKCDSYSEVLCGFDPAKIKQEHVDFANERMASSLTPGEDFTTQQQKDIPDQLHASFSNQPTKPVI